MMFRKLPLFFLLIINFCCYSRESYVTTHLMGELGNQMFQIAAALSHAKDTDSTATFPDLIAKKHNNHDKNLKYIFHNLHTSRPKRRLKHYKETSFNFSPIPKNKHNISLIGYFQSEKYFVNNKDLILKTFAPPAFLEENLKSRYQNLISHKNSVAIHIRTYNKDLKWWPDIHEFHPIISLNYIERAVNHFESTSFFAVFSDDIPYAKKMLKPLEKKLKNSFLFIEGNEHYEDFYLMSFCKHNIISNSSFSWWAAYLNKNPSKKVIAPQKWFGPKQLQNNTRDLIPKSWIIL